MEAIAIIGCIAAVVSAYRDGGAILDKIKEKRVARHAPLPPRLLQDSLARGPRAVEEAKDTGIERFGTKYADKIALDSLKDILIDLQGSLLKHLRQAQEDDNMTDFTTLVDASDIGRIRTVTVLNELYVRVARGTTLTQTPFGDMGSLSPRQDGSIAPDVVTQVNISPPASLSRGKAIQQSVSSAFPESSEQPKEQRSTAKAGFFDKFRRKSSSDDNSTATSSRRSSSLLPKREVADQGDGRARTLSLSPMASPPTTIDEDNPWAAEDTQRSTMDRETIARRFLLPSVNAGVEWPATAFDCFCKGAYKMQTHEKDAMKLRNLPVAKTGGSHYLACISEGRKWTCCSSHCVFEGPARPVGNKWAFDDTVREASGVRYRWSFLAKAHVAVSKAKDGRYDYGCVFCIYDGHECPVFHGIRDFLEHVGEHRGKPIAETMLQRVKCVKDRTAALEEDFDVNLKPLEMNPHATLEDTAQSARHSLLSSAASGRVSWTAADETADVDPWRDAA